MSERLTTRATTEAFATRDISGCSWQLSSWQPHSWRLYSWQRWIVISALSSAEAIRRIELNPRTERRAWLEPGAAFHASDQAPRGELARVVSRPCSGRVERAASSLASCSAAVRDPRARRPTAERLRVPIQE
jgi:hypothetical protein